MSHDLGVISEKHTPESLAEKIRGLNHSAINHFKRKAHAAARRLSADANRETLLNLVQSLCAASQPS